MARVLRPQHKREQHVEPRRYLKGFAIPAESFIWVFTKDKPFRPGRKVGRDNPARMGLGHAGAERDTFAVTLPSGERDFNTFEDLFQTIETTADSVWPLIENREPLSHEHKEILAGYICHLFKRGRKRRKDSRPLFQGEAAQHAEQVRTLARRLSDQGDFATARRLLDDAEYFCTDAGTDWFLLATACLEYQRMKREIMERSWQLLVAPDGSNFVTSDDPVLHDERGLLLGPVLFPLCRRVLLLAERRGVKDLAYVSSPSGDVYKFNYLMAGRCLSTIYSPTPDENLWNAMHGRSVTPSELQL